MARKRGAETSSELVVPEQSDRSITKPSGRGGMVCPETDRLLEDGSANPQWVWRNLCDLGKSCPKDHYVQSPVLPTYLELSQMWGVGDVTIHSWATKQNWSLQRKLEWDKISDATWQEEAKALMALRKREVYGQRERWEKLRVVLEQLLVKGTITEQTATGYIYEREFSPKDVKDITMALQNCDENISRTIGYERTNLQRQAMAQAVSEPPVQTKIRTVRHVFTKAEEVYETPALPPAPEYEEGVIEE